MYILKFTDAAVADVRAIPKGLRNLLRKALAGALARDPIGQSKELKRELAGFRSFAVKDYRVVFKIFEDLEVIAVVGIGLRAPHSRENIYRKLERLAAAGQLAQGVLSSIRRFTR